MNARLLEDDGTLPSFKTEDFLLRNALWEEVGSMSKKHSKEKLKLSRNHLFSRLKNGYFKIHSLHGLERRKEFKILLSNN